MTDHKFLSSWAVTCVLASTVSAGDQLTVTNVEPPARTVTAAVDSPIVVHFDRPIEPGSVTALGSFWAFGKWSGTVSGAFSFSNGNQSVTLTPDQPFSPGEMVMVILSHDLEAMDGTFLRSAGYSFQFWTASAPASMDFTEIDVLSTNVGLESSRPYGGNATDLNNDGWLDISTVNEDTNDIRVLLNSADGLGSFDDVLTPITATTGGVPSPSEPSDFNRDGNADFCTANTQNSSVSIVLGNGDGTFGPQQFIVVGSTPRGIAVLDADGDGDIDVVNTNNGSGTLTIMLNDGTGTFSGPTSFDGGGTSEWGLAAADLDEDGILDLVVGCQNEVIVHRGNGDGTFSIVSENAHSGRAWMLVTGDVDNDGHEDVALVNTSNGLILHGDGTGDLGAADTYPTDPFSLATDLGDLDGDGDLDWVNASFGGDWFMYTNDGDGTFTFDREFLAPANASCALAMDIDNDGDLDLALIDEIADTVSIWSNGGPNVQPDCVDLSDCADVNGDDIRDDNCIWWACIDGVCAGTDVPFADMGGQFGDCAPDGTADNNDRNHALNCFANTDPNGGAAYACEPHPNHPPVALNVDAGGQFGDCAPDGVCDGNDAFAALNAFGGLSGCSCPEDGGPAPTGTTHIAVSERVRLAARPVLGRVAPGDTVAVEVMLDGPLNDLRGYQLHMGVSGGRSGSLTLVDVAIAPRPRADHAFNRVGHWVAFNTATAQMVAGLDTPGIASPTGAYLATFTYRVSADARGTFAIEPLADPNDPTHRTFLFPTAPQTRIAVVSVAPARITVVRMRARQR